jgi:hypothetical protein
MIVRDLIVDTQKQECEEEKRCLHLGCSLNRTTKTSHVNSEKGEGTRRVAVERLLVAVTDPRGQAQRDHGRCKERTI